MLPALRDIFIVKCFWKLFCVCERRQVTVARKAFGVVVIVIIVLTVFLFFKPEILEDIYVLRRRI